MTCCMPSYATVTSYSGVLASPTTSSAKESNGTSTGRQVAWSESCRPHMARLTTTLGLGRQFIQKTEGSRIAFGGLARMNDWHLVLMQVKDRLLPHCQIIANPRHILALCPSTQWRCTLLFRVPVTSSEHTPPTFDINHHFGSTTHKTLPTAKVFRQHKHHP